MRSVGIKALKNELSRYVRAAAAGETIQVTDRDKVVAELVPPRAQRLHGAPLSDEALTMIGVREGWLTPATRKGPLSAPVGLPNVPLQQLLDELEKDREDR